MKTTTKKKVGRAQPVITARSIAKDSLMLLNARRLVAQQMTYLQPQDGVYDVDLKGLLTAKVKKPCTVCALGAVFCGLVKTVNTYQADTRAGSMRLALEPYLGLKQVCLIESAFEGLYGPPILYDRASEVSYTPEERAATSDYRNKNKLWDDEACLRAILRDIVTHGEFDPARPARPASGTRSTASRSSKRASEARSEVLA